MQAARADEIEAAQFATHRPGEIKFAQLLRGDPDAPDNFEWSITRIAEDYSTPRHHHNFDQMHFVIEGGHESSPDHFLPEGTVTYFPEGAYYGPQSGHGGRMLGLQFGGPSGSGFMSYERLATGNKQLAEQGTFADGMYHPASGDAEVVDGYEAIWAHVNGRPVTYPQPRYDRPITMHPDAFTWTPVEGEAGVEEKLLGDFTERHVRVGFHRYEPGARHQLNALDATHLHFVWRGEVRIDGQRFGDGSALRFDKGETVTIEAISDAELYWIKLPTF